MPQNTQLTKKDIALDLMTSSKAEITTLTKVLTETTNSQLRNTLMSELTTCSIHITDSLISQLIRVGIMHIKLLPSNFNKIYHVLMKLLNK
jgi:Coat F domain.